MIQKPMLRVEVCTRALRASQNVKKRCVPCVFAPTVMTFVPCRIVLVHVQAHARASRSKHTSAKCRGMRGGGRVCVG